MHEGEGYMKKRLGELLLERGLVNIDQLNAALGHQRQWGVRLGTALVARGYIPEAILTRVLAESLGMPMVDLARIIIDPHAIALVPRRLAEQHELFPIELQKKTNGRRLLLLAMADPLNATAIDEVAFTTDTIVKPAIAQISSVQQAIRRHYYGEYIEVTPLPAHKTTITGWPTSDATPAAVDAASTFVEDTTGPQAAMPPPPPLDYRSSLQPLGVFSMPPRSAGSELSTAADIMPFTLSSEVQDIEALQNKFWALMRVLARRGLVSKDEFLAELAASEQR